MKREEWFLKNTIEKRSLNRKGKSRNQNLGFNEIILRKNTKKKTDNKIKDKTTQSKIDDPYNH